MPLYRQLHDQPEYSLRVQGSAQELGAEVVILVAELRSEEGKLVERWEVGLARQTPAFLASASRYGPSGQLETQYEAKKLGRFRTASGQLVSLVTECAVRFYVFQPPDQPRQHLVLKKPWSEWQMGLVRGTVRLGRSIPDQAIAVQDPEDAVALKHGDREVRIGRATTSGQPTAADVEPRDANQVPVGQRVARVEDELPSTNRWALFLAVVGIVAIVSGLLGRWRANRTR